MPEGDTIHRAARALDRALAGHTVTAFESVFPRLTRVDQDHPIRGRTIERVESAGKHLLMRFSGNLVLRTHMRMNGSWHIYRPGERWQRPLSDMRIVIRTAEFEAVAFTVPVAEFSTVDDAARALSELGPDPLAAGFDAVEATRRLRARGEMAIADALLDQRAVAGLGNVFKSEVLFAGRVSPFARAGDLPEAVVARLVELAATFMRVSVEGGERRTRGSLDRTQRLAVYGRAGKPCFRCGRPISRAKQGPDARSTYWCENCQPRSSRDPPVPTP
jgi:endonuclease VIII